MMSSCLCLIGLLLGAEPLADGWQPEWSTFDASVIPVGERDGAVAAVRGEQMRRRQQLNDRSTDEWRKVRTRADWESFRRDSIAALKASLGTFPEPPRHLHTRVTGTLQGDGYRINNLLFESRAGLWVSANCYLPTQARPSMTGFLICHSHHTPKEHGELQDMGMTWARAGCVVLVMDQLGHGERRQHPFRTAADYPGEFRPSRQDYYFRYDSGLQLHLIGDSLIGWMAWDLMRGVDLLLATPGVDARRIVLLGSVAGGGDPAAVTAAIDERIAATVPFNFGGPQPETRYPLPEDAERAFNYVGGGSFESTRNLRRSAADGFLPWVIVGSIAPRALCYAHEFAWDQPRDPVWKRLEQIYGWYHAGQLGETHGRGSVRGEAPKSTHCTHIGRFHRQAIHPLFEKWLDIRVTPADEYSQRREPAELQCWTGAASDELRPRLLTSLLPELAAERLAAARARRADLPAENRRQALRTDLRRVLGDIDPRPATVERVISETGPGGLTVVRTVLRTDDGVTLPLLTLQRDRAQPEKRRLPAVVAFCQEGKQDFIRQRAAELTTLTDAGWIVCLPDLRGTGETRADRGRDADGGDTSQSSLEQMLGGTMVGVRLRDLQTVLAHLRALNTIDGDRIALWGDSLAVPNGPNTNWDVPRRIDERPRQSEPLGALLALLGGLYDERIVAVYANRGLVDFQSVLSFYQVFVPHDAIVPGLLMQADLPDVAAALAPRPLRIAGLVDERNHPAATEAVFRSYQVTRAAYERAGASERLSLGLDDPRDAAWLIEAERK